MRFNMLIVDTREKRWKHIENYLWIHNIEYKIEKLDVGDYMLTEKPHISIDRKANLDEISANLMSGQGNYHRFLKEVKRAKSSGIKLIILIEGTRCRSVEDVKKWRSKYSNITGAWLYRQMKNLSYGYGIDWRFCRADQTAKNIIKILNEEDFGWTTRKN